MFKSAQCFEAVGNVSSAAFLSLFMQLLSIGCKLRQFIIPTDKITLVTLLFGSIFH